MNQIESKQKCPPNHAVAHGGNNKVYYIRREVSTLVEKDTHTARKIRNLILLFLLTTKKKLHSWLLTDVKATNFYDEKRNVAIDKFCNSREISKTTFLRIKSTVNKYHRLCGNHEEIVKFEQPIRQHLTILALLDYLLHESVAMQHFCDLFQISRRTFFRYISKIENFLYNEHVSEWNVAITNDGEYCLVC